MTLVGADFVDDVRCDEGAEPDVHAEAFDFSAQPSGDGSDVGAVRGAGRDVDLPAQASAGLVEMHLVAA